MVRGLMNMIVTSMIFFPEKTFNEKPEDYHFVYEDVRLETSDHVRLHGWFFKAPAEKEAILFFHGNAGNISGRLFKAKGWIERGYSVFLVDYRGYGKSEGKIEAEADLYRDAEAALEWLTGTKKVSPSRIILYGESLGSAAAVKLGMEIPVGAVVLEAAFTSFLDLARTHYPFVPEMFLKDFEFSNLDRIAELKAPLFILHGARDEICPYAMSGKLFEKAPEPKGFLSVPSGMHNDLPFAAGEDFWQKPAEFLQKHLG